MYVVHVVNKRKIHTNFVNMTVIATGVNLMRKGSKVANIHPPASLCG